MHDKWLNSLASSIARDGQPQLGLARRLPPDDTHAVAEVLRTQRDGWKKAMVRAIRGTEADPGGA